LQACRRACTIESEFLCRSFLYNGNPNGNDYNCKLYHLDHWTLADGIGAFLNSNTPLTIPNGQRIGSYYENRCERESALFSNCLCETMDILGFDLDICGFQCTI
jgi:hypothetical protein